MGIAQTFVIYVLLGISVAIAMVAAGRCALSLRGVTLFTSSILLWPFYLPALIQSRQQQREDSSTAAPHCDDPRLAAAHRHFVDAIAQLDGDFAETLTPSLKQVVQLTSSLSLVKTRMTEMDSILNAADTSTDNATVQCNRDRLAAIREREHQKYQQALLQIEEMTSTLQLLRFSDYPEEEIVACLSDLGSRIEAISEAMVCTEPENRLPQ